MPRSRPATTGYERLAQADRFSDDSDNEDEPHGGLFGSSVGQPPRPSAGMAASLPSMTTTVAAGTGTARRSYPYAGAPTPGGGGGGPARFQQRRRTNSGVDLKAINARLERWADEIAAKFKRAKRPSDAGDEERLEIHYSVFQAPEGVRPVTAEGLAVPSTSPMTITKDEFEAIVQSVRTAIGAGVHPRMISQGSSGSYFARNPDGKVVGVFKPKDEEPYAAGNPKWNKWIHRNLFPCCFGRACLIPNLSYVSEAAAYVLDAQLRTHIVPYTDVVYLASKSFHYPFWDRYSYSRSRKPLPAKPGSFQVFLKGFKDANIFLRENPWPDQYLSGFRTGRHRGGGGAGGRRRRWADSCRPGSKHGGGGNNNGSSNSRNRNGNGGAIRLNTADGSGSGSGSGLGNGGGGGGGGSDDTYYSDYDDGYDDEPSPDRPPGPDHFVWTEPLKQSFREQLEKLVILDYIMRNTDRGLDNWMVKIDWPSQAVSITSEPMHLNMDGGGSSNNGGGGDNDDDDDTAGSGSGSDQRPRPVDLSQRPAPRARAPYPSYRAPKPMDASTPPAENWPQPTMTLGAIDNSLSWPWKHPDAWRSFPFGWLFLPVDLIGRPFSQKTRDHFLPLLTSTAWWSETQLALRRIFMMDPDFKERMFARQIAVMKGQAWNVVETLKTPDHGPLELTRRAKVCVWDDLVEVPIAVPMRATSSEIRRRAESELAKAMEEEMDIGAVGSSSDAGAAAAAASAVHDSASEDLLLSPQLAAHSAAGAARLPHPGRFELTKESVAEEDEDAVTMATTTTTTTTGGNSAGRRSASRRQDGVAEAVVDEHTPASPPTSLLSTSPRTRRKSDISAAGALALAPSGSSRLPRTSIGGGGSGGGGGGGSGNSLNMYTPQRERRYSYTTVASRRNSSSLAQALYGGGPSSSSAAAAAATIAGPSGTNPFRNPSADDYLYYDEDIDGDLGYAAAEGMENNRRRVIVERLEPVKSKNPVFTWC